jgi:hypothetical protein
MRATGRAIVLFGRQRSGYVPSHSGGPALVLRFALALAFTDGEKLALKGYGTLKKLTAAGNVRVVTVLDCRHHPLKAIWMPAIYHSSSEQIDRSLEMEAEYLLPRNLRFVLKDRREFKDDIGPFFIELVEPAL